MNPLANTTARPLVATPNPLLATDRIQTFQIDSLESPLALTRPVGQRKREMRDLRRRQSAAEAIAGLAPGLEIYGFSKGQFSMLDLIAALLQFTGPADVVLSTWTAARAEIIALDKFLKEGALKSMRWLVDFTFARRDPQAAHQIRQTFGLESIRVAQTHAKFCLFTNERWQVVLRTSMNLNINPRFEDFTIAHDPELATFLQTIVEEIWSRQTRQLADAAPRDIKRHFADHM